MPKIVEATGYIAETRKPPFKDGYEIWVTPTLQGSVKYPYHDILDGLAKMFLGITGQQVENAAREETRYGFYGPSRLAKDAASLIMDTYFDELTVVLPPVLKDDINAKWPNRLNSKICTEVTCYRLKSGVLSEVA
jgi:hypothetical protein